jgi:signal transduction histidine kinase
MGVTVGFEVAHVTHGGRDAVARLGVAMAALTPFPGTFPSDFPDDGRDSAAFDLARCSVLALVPGSRLPAELAELLVGAKLALMPAESVQAAESMGYLPMIALIDVEVPGAIELVKRISAGPRYASVIAIGTGAAGFRALQCGAAAALSYPLDPTAVLLLAEHLRTARNSFELFGRQHANVPVETTTRVTAAIAHEIRNPLGVALGNVTLLQDSWSRDAARLAIEERDEMMRDVRQALETIERIVTAMRGLASGERPKISPLVLTEAVKEAVTATLNPNKVPIEIAATSNVIGMANRALLVEVIVNLLANAQDALRGVANPKILIRTYETTGEARISIRDNGPGIPQELRERIFEPFFSTKRRQNSGLGLAIARHAVVSMGGALTLSAEPPPGTCFRIRLPRHVSAF